MKGRREGVCWGGGSQLWAVVGSFKAEPLLSGFIFRGTSEPNMATLSGSRGDRLANSNHQKASLVSPEKVREILNQGVSSTTGGSIRCVHRSTRRRACGVQAQLWLARVVSHLAWQRLQLLRLLSAKRPDPRASSHPGARGPEHESS